jgi:hypothetical protein
MLIKRSYIFIALVAAIGLYMIYESLSLPAGEDLKGSFKELAFYRNEQNTGPVLRVYAVSVGDTVWQEMETYGNMMPHSKYGNTKVYYFLKGKADQKYLSQEDGSISPPFKEAYIAKFEKGAMGQTVLVKFPFGRAKEE